MFLAVVNNLGIPALIDQLLVYPEQRQVSLKLLIGDAQRHET